MRLPVPKRGLPVGARARQCELGVDLSAQFITDLQGLDKDLHPFFHPYKILWDDFVNEYDGELEDPRYDITTNSNRAGELVLGHILTNGQGQPTADGNWHIWRWSEPAGAWSHVIAIESREEQYLRLLVERLHLQATYNDKYGNRGYQKLLEEMDIAGREKAAEEKADLLNEVNKANSNLMNRAMENMRSGKTAPTNPIKETIMSGAGLSNRSKMVRPLEDREGGLILPPGYGE